MTSAPSSRACGAACTCTSVSPTIDAARCAAVVSCTARVSTLRPSRITVTVSQAAMISEIRWLISVNDRSGGELLELVEQGLAARRRTGWR